MRLSKDGSAFCYPEHIGREARILFRELKNQAYLRGVASDAFARSAARFLATLNAIHPFREGNGRCQLTFLVLLAHGAGHALAIERLDPESFLAAMIASFHGSDEPLCEEIRRLIDDSPRTHT